MSEWLDTPEGRACVEAGAERLWTNLRSSLYRNSGAPSWEAKPNASQEHYRSDARAVLAAALDVRVECEACEGTGFIVNFDVKPEEPLTRTMCASCRGGGKRPVLYPREEKP